MNYPTDIYEKLNKTDQLAIPMRPYCIVLGGGGARGLAHLGVMHAIGELRIPVGRLVGVSMGALMAGLCLVERDAVRARERAMEFSCSRNGRKLNAMLQSTTGLSSSGKVRKMGARLFRELRKQKVLSRAVRSQSLLPSTILREMIEALIPDIDILDLPTPLQIVTVDLEAGQRVVLDSGSLRRAIRASMSIPGVFPAVHHDGRMLSDIGVYNSVPCDIPANGRNMPFTNEGIIAVDVGQQMNELATCNSALESMLRFQSLAEQKIRQHSLMLADVVVRPVFEPTAWFDFANLESLIQSGYEAAISSLAIRSGSSTGGHSNSVPISDVPNQATRG